MSDLTVNQLAEALQCSTTKLSRMTRAGRIPCLKIGRLVRSRYESRAKLSNWLVAWLRFSFFRPAIAQYHLSRLCSHGSCRR